MLAKRLLAALIVAASCAPLLAEAPLWRLSPDLTFSTMSLGFEPLDTALSAAAFLGAKGDTYVKAGYGLVLDDDYYLLMPERESAVGFYAGYETYGAGGSSFSPGGAAMGDPAHRSFSVYYLKASLDQVLAGDRRHGRTHLLASLSDLSRFVSPGIAEGEAAAPEAFSAHSLRAALSFNVGSRWPLWDVASLSGSLSATMELGHSASRGFWDFALADASLRFRLPIIGEGLYLSAGAKGSSFLANLSPSAPIPAWYYGLYSSGISLSGEADLRSRVARFNPMVPMALDLCLGVTAGQSSADWPELSPAGFSPRFRACSDLLIETGAFGDFRVRAGLSLDPVGMAVQPVFSVLSGIE